MEGEEGGGSVSFYISLIPILPLACTRALSLSEIWIMLRVKWCKGMPPKAFEVGALRAKNLILWFAPVMLTPALLSLSLHLLWSLPPADPPI